MVCVLAPFNYILYATYLSPWCRRYQTIVRSAVMVRCGTGVLSKGFCTFAARSWEPTVYKIRVMVWERDDEVREPKV